MISINATTRQFTIPGTDLVFGVEADSGTERKHFQCPRYVGDGLDVAACFVRINYRNASGETDSYLVDDLVVDGTNIKFSWLLHPKVTAYRGQVKFVMCLVGPDLKLKWHTTLGTGQVNEGLEPDNSHVEGETGDVVAALIAMVTAQTAAVESVGEAQRALIRSAAETASANAVAEIEAKRVNSLASIPNDYTALSNSVEKLVRSATPGIICDAEGAAITLSDASDNYVSGLRIFGKSTQSGIPTPDNPVEIVSVENPVVMVGGRNLCNPTAFNTMTEVAKSTNTYDPNSRTLTMIANPVGVAGRYSIPLHNLVIGRSYVVSFDLRGTAGKSVKCGWDRNPARITLTDGFTRYSSTIVATRKDEPVIFYSNATADGGLVTGEFLQFANVQIEPGTVANPYEPYKPAQTIEITHPLRGIQLITSSIVTAEPNYIDSDGERWVCDEVDFERGVYIKRVEKYVMDGTRPVVMLSTTAEKTRFDVDWIVGMPGGGVMCDSLRWDVSQQTGTVQIHGDTGKLVLFVDKANNVADFMAYLREHPMNILTQISPIETPLTETELAAYRSLRTYKPNTTILNDSGAHMTVEYTADTKLYIDNKIKEVK